MNKSKILIVNDREENLVALEQLLCDLDVEIVRALSGNEAISKTLESEFVIALLDVQMPEMDGFETLKLLRKNKQTKNLPVIFITTTYHDEYSKIKGIERGAVDFLIKPIVPELLLGKIRVFLNLYHQRIKLSNTIAERDKALEELGSYRDHLEEIVAKRTNELEELNNGLEKKIEVFKKTEKTLKENEALLRKMAENYPNSFISIIKSDLTIGFTAGQEFKKNNLDPEKFIGIKIEQVFGENTPIVKKHYLKSFKGKETNFELLINNQYQLYKTVPLYDENGKITQILVVVENITERKQAEEELRLKNLVFESAITANSTYDNDGIITHCNSAFLKMWGYNTKNKVIGKPILHFLKNKDEALKIITSIDESGAWEGEYIGSKKDGSIFNAYALSTIIWNEKKEKIGYQSAVLDITMRKQTEAELKIQREHLEEMVKERTKELEDKNAELERFNELFVNREFIIKELKEKIKILES